MSPILARRWRCSILFNGVTSQVGTTIVVAGGAWSAGVTLSATAPQHRGQRHRHCATSDPAERCPTRLRRYPRRSRSTARWRATRHQQVRAAAGVTISGTATPASAEVASMARPRRSRIVDASNVVRHPHGDSDGRYVDGERHGVASPGAGGTAFTRSRRISRIVSAISQLPRRCQIALDATGTDGGGDGDGAECRYSGSRRTSSPSVAPQTVSGSYSGTLGAGRVDPGQRQWRHDLGGRERQRWTFTASGVT